MDVDVHTDVVANYDADVVVRINNFVLNVNMFVNSCNVSYICK